LWRIIVRSIAGYSRDLGMGKKRKKRSKSLQTKLREDMIRRWSRRIRRAKEKWSNNFISKMNKNLRQGKI
jgi:hypothetical protein